MTQRTSTMPNFDPGAMIAPLMSVQAAFATEMAEFGAARLQANAERFRHWAEAKSPIEVLDQEMKFAAAAFSAYSDEATRMMDILGKATDEAAKAPARREAAAD
jgi:hypothetical protein